MCKKITQNIKYILCIYILALLRNYVLQLLLKRHRSVTKIGEVSVSVPTGPKVFTHFFKTGDGSRRNDAPPSTPTTAAAAASATI